MCGGILGAGYGANWNNCHNNCNIITNVNNGKIWVGLIGTGFKGNGECVAKNCSALKVENYLMFSEFNKTTTDDSVILCENESEMPNILDVLGKNFKMGPNGYPVLSWQ